MAAGSAGGLEEGDGEERAFAAAAGAGAHLDGEPAPEAAVAGLRAVFEFGDGVGVFVAEGLDRLFVAADVTAEPDAVAFLVAVAGAEVGDLEPDVDAVAEGEPVEVEDDGVEAKGEGVVGGHWSDRRTRGCMGGVRGERCEGERGVVAPLVPSRASGRAGRGRGSKAGRAWQYCFDSLSANARGPRDERKGRRSTAETHLRGVSTRGLCLASGKASFAGGDAPAERLYAGPWPGRSRKGRRSPC